MCTVLFVFHIIVPDAELSNFKFWVCSTL